METFSSKIKQQDPDAYINVDTQEITYIYQPFTNFFTSLCSSVHHFLFTDHSKADLPAHLQGKYIFQRPQVYRPVPTKKVSLQTLQQMKLSSKGFDPIKMTLARCKQSQRQKDGLKLLPLKPEKSSVELEQEVLPLKKTIKRYCFQFQETDDKQKPKQAKSQFQIQEAIIKSALDQLVKDIEEKKIKLQDSCFRPFFANEKKQQIKQTHEEKELESQVRQPTPAQPLHEQQALSKTTGSSVVSLQRVVNGEKENPFKTALVSKPLSLIGLISNSKNTNNNELFPAQNASVSSESTKSDTSSTLTFNPQSHHKFNFTNTSNSTPNHSQPSLPYFQLPQNTNEGKDILKKSNQQFKPNSQFRQYNEPAPRPFVPISHPKPAQTIHQNQFMKGTSRPANNLFKSNSGSNSGLFDAPSEKTQKKTPQGYHKRKKETNGVRIK